MANGNSMYRGEEVDECMEVNVMEVNVMMCSIHSVPSPTPTLKRYVKQKKGKRHLTRMRYMPMRSTCDVFAMSPRQLADPPTGSSHPSQTTPGVSEATVPDKVRSNQMRLGCEEAWSG